MSTDPITNEVSERICKHMNCDHAEAVMNYAHYYGEIKEAQTAKMVLITPEAMELEVDGQSIKINFDHTLADSKDAHQTLVAMLKAIP